MSITLIFFVVAFILARFVTAGVGVPSPQQCDYISSEVTLLEAIASGKIPDSEANHWQDKTLNVLSASAYATLGMVCLLIVIVTVLSLKETKLAEYVSENCAPLAAQQTQVITTEFTEHP